MALITKDLFGNISINGLSPKEAKDVECALRESTTARRNASIPLSEIVATIITELGKKL